MPQDLPRNMSRRIRRDLLSDSLALTNLPENIEMDRKTGTLTATLDSLASLNHCPSNFQSRTKAAKRKEKASRSVLVNIDNKSRSTKPSKPGSAMINTEKLTACDSLSQLGKKSHSQVQDGGLGSLVQLSNTPFPENVLRQREVERLAVGPRQPRPGFHRGGPQALVKSHKVRAKLRDIALGRKSTRKRTGNGILSMFGVGTAGPVNAHVGGKRNLNGAHSRGAEGSGPSCNGLVDLMGRMTVKAKSTGDGNKTCAVGLPAVGFRKRSSKPLSEVSRTAKRLSQKKTPNKKAFTKIMEGKQKSDSLQFLSEEKPNVLPKRNETSNQLGMPSFQQVSASDKCGDIVNPDDIARMIVDKIPVQVRRSEAKAGEEHDSVSTLGVDDASREGSTAFFQGGIPSEIIMEAPKADIYEGPWTCSPDFNAPVDYIQSRSSVCSSVELFSAIQSSTDRLFFIAHQPEGTRHVRWFLVTADIQQTLAEPSCGDPQQSGKYHVRFYARHPGDPYMLAENEARWWPELHNYSIDNAGTIHYGDRVLVDPTHVPDTKKIIAWSAVVDLTDPEVHLLGPFDFQDALLNSPDRTPAFRQYVPSKHWADLAKACIARSIHPPDIAAPSNGSNFSNRAIAVAGMVPVENSRGRLLDIGKISPQLNQTQERVLPIPNDTLVPRVSSSVTGEFELTEGKKQGGPTLDATNKRSYDDREESPDCPNDRKTLSSPTTEARTTVLTRSQKRKEEQRNAEENQQQEREKANVRPVMSASPRLNTSNSAEDSMCKDKSTMDMGERPGARTSSRRRLPTQFFTPGCETSKSRNLSPSELEDDMDVDSPAEASPEISSHSQKDREEKVSKEPKLSRELSSDRSSSKSKSELTTSPKHIHTTNQHRKTQAKITETTWTARQISQLKEAQKLTKPTSNTFWDDIAALVDDKSATDCQERWFSLVKTPMPKLCKPSRMNHAANHHPVVPSSNMDDDIFNSTPMRDLSELPSFHGVTLTDNGLLGKLDFETRLTGASAGDDLHFNGKNEMPSKLGYKTYVLGMKRAINKSKKTKARNTQRVAMKKAGAYNALSGSVRDDEVDLNALLTPGGTLKVKNHSSFEEDEFWDGDECEYGMQ